MTGRGYRILVCHGPDCSEQSSEEIVRLFAREIRIRSLQERVRLFEYSCFGQCQTGPNVVIGPRREEVDPLFGEAAHFPGDVGEFLYSGVAVEDVPVLFTEHILRGRPVARLLQGKEHQ